MWNPGDPEETELHDVVLDEEGEDLPGFESLHEHEEGNSYPRDVPVVEAQINEGIGSTGGVDITVGHVINEHERAGPIQMDGLFVVHRHKEIGVAFP
jgi:hypothetical protein